MKKLLLIALVLSGCEKSEVQPSLSGTKWERLYQIGEIPEQIKVLSFTKDSVNIRFVKTVDGSVGNFNGTYKYTEQYPDFNILEVASNNPPGRVDGGTLLLGGEYFKQLQP